MREIVQTPTTYIRDLAVSETSAFPPTPTHIPMYSLDSLSNHTLLSHKPRASDAHSDMLGKRHTLLNHDSFHSFSNSVDVNTTPLKRQKVSTHINTRHVALHFPHPSHQQNVSEAAQSPVNPPLFLQEPLVDSGTERQQPSTSYAIDGMENAIMSVENVSMDEINIHHATDDITGQSDSNVSSLGSRESPSNITLVHTLDRLILDNNIASNQVPSTSYVNSRQEGQSFTIPQAVSNTTSDILSDHSDDIVAAVQVTEFFKRVQSWTSAIEKLCNAREKQLLYLELFGEKPTFTPNSPDLLNLLEEIDEQKNLVTLQEAYFTNLAEKIDEVLKTCKASRDWQIISLATRILDNFYQRFQNRRFP